MFLKERGKKTINDTIKKIPLEHRGRAIEMQKGIDKMLKGAKRPEDRLILMQTIFWSQTVNVFIPSLESCYKNLSLLSKGQSSRVPLKLLLPKPKL